MGGCFSSGDRQEQPHEQSISGCAEAVLAPIEPPPKQTTAVEHAAEVADSTPLTVGELHPAPKGTEEDGPTTRLHRDIADNGQGASSTEAGPSFRDMSAAQPTTTEVPTSSQMAEQAQPLLPVLPLFPPTTTPSPDWRPVLPPIGRPSASPPSPESLSLGARPLQHPSPLQQTPTESPIAPGRGGEEASPPPPSAVSSVGLSPLGNPPVEWRRRSSAASASDSDVLGSPCVGPDSMMVLGQIMGLGTGEAQAQPAHTGHTGELEIDHGGLSLTSKPSADEIMQYARQLGMDMAKDCDLLWIAEQALQAPVPANWSVYYDAASGNEYYANNMTGVTTWEHPLDEHFRAMYVQMSQEKDRARMKAEVQSMKLQTRAQREQQRGRGQGRPGQDPVWRQTLDDSFRTDVTGTDTDLDESRTSWGGDSSLATSRDSALTRTMDMTATTMDSHSFVDTYDSLNMSLSSSKVGGLQLNLAGIQKQQLRQSRGAGLGLQLKVHRSAKPKGLRSSAEQPGLQRPFVLGTRRIPVCSKGDVGQYDGRGR